MMPLRKDIFCLLLLFLIQLAEGINAKKEVLTKILKNKAKLEEASGSGHLLQGKKQITTNRARKDYIIAVEDNPSKETGVDPVFQLLKGLAHRTRGKMAVLDYGDKIQNYDSDDNSDNEYYNNDSDSDDDEDYGDESPFKEKESSLGQNILRRFLHKNIFDSDDDDRYREKDEFRLSDNRNDIQDDEYDNAPSVVYEMDNNDGEEQSPGFPGNFGNARSMFADDNEDEDSDERK